MTETQPADLQAQIAQLENDLADNAKKQDALTGRLEYLDMQRRGILLLAESHLAGRRRP